MRFHPFDDLVGVWNLLDPGEARSRRDLRVDVASAGDLGACRSRSAARAAWDPYDAVTFPRAG